MNTTEKVVTTPWKSLDQFYSVYVLKYAAC